jgi:hypothetical protein
MEVSTLCCSDATENNLYDVVEIHLVHAIGYRCTRQAGSITVMW